jgi:predicted phosphodiesterase
VSAPRDAEIFGVTESTLTVAYRLDATEGAELLLDDRVIATAEGSGVHLHRIEGLDPDREYRISLRALGGRAAEQTEHDAYFPERVRTLPAPTGTQVATFATLNDVHFGEPRVGGVLDENMEYGDEELPGYPLVRESDDEIPYWRYMNDDAIDEINESDADLAFVKGDIANSGEAWQFEAAREAFSRFSMPHHAFLGNHDYFAVRRGEPVDGYALLGQPPAPRTVDLAGWRLILLETAVPGEDVGAFDAERREWLADELATTRDAGQPTLLLMHHQPVPHEHAHEFPNTIGIDPDHSLPLFELLRGHEQLRGVLIGHTHKNRVRRYRPTGALPFVEVQCSKDYPGGWAHYRLFDDGSFRQEVVRTSSERALAHSARCRHLFRGGYRSFTLGRLAERSFAIPSMEP